METEKCTALLCALEHGTLAAAAEELGYTTSAISRMVSSLEEELGIPLLYRSRSGIRATPACESVLPHMKQMVYYQSCCRETAAAISGLQTGTIIIGTAYSFSFRELTRLIAEFQMLYPGIHFETVGGTSAALLDDLRDHKIDLCIISRWDDVPQWLCLTRDEMVAILPSNHALAQHSSIPLDVLEQEPFIELYPGRISDSSRFIEKHRLNLHRTSAADDVFSALLMVEAGMGITMVNGVMSDMLRGDVVFRPLTPGLYVEIGIVAPDHEEMSPAALEFFQFVETRYPL